jgi:hypothetical protein
MIDGGNGDRSGLHLAVRGEKLLNRSEAAAIEFAGNGVGTRGVGIDHAYQPDGVIQLRELVVDAGVIASESADADDRDLNEIVRQDCTLSLLPETFD